MSVDLAVVVITRNEEARIRACLEASMRSIQKAKEAGLIQTAEIILVDSASTDSTIEIASEFSITIVRLKDDWPLSAAAGRFVGLRNTASDLVLFVDGDYVLFEDWLPVAIRALRTGNDVAAVCGRDVEESTGDSLLMRFSKKSTESVIGDPEAVPVGLYRRNAVQSVGGIHPFLRGAEDRELALRLRASGYRLLRTGQAMGSHRWSDKGPLDFVTYFRSVLSWSIGDGQIFRGMRRIPRVPEETRQRYVNARYTINYVVGLLLAALALGNTTVGIPAAVPFVIASDAAALLVLLALRRARGWTWRDLAFQVHAIPYSVVRHGGFIIGMLSPPRDPSHYPIGESVLKRSGAFADSQSES